MQNSLVAAALAELTPPSFDDIMEALDAHEEDAARLKKMVKAYAKSKGDKKTRAGSFPKGTTPVQVKRWNAFVEHVRVKSGIKVDEAGAPVLVKDKETGEMKQTYNMTLQEALSEASRLKGENPAIVEETLGPIPPEEAGAAASKAAAMIATKAAAAAAKAAERELAKADKIADREAAKAAKAEAAAILKAEKAAAKAEEREAAKAAKAETAAALKAAKVGGKDGEKAAKAAAAAAERESKKAAAAEAREILKAQKEAEKLATRQTKLAAAGAAKAKPSAKAKPAAPAAAAEEEEDDLSAFTFKGATYWRDADNNCWLNASGGLGPWAGKYDPVADKINAKAKEPAVKSA